MNQRFDGTPRISVYGNSVLLLACATEFRRAFEDREHFPYPLLSDFNVSTFKRLKSL